jgi:hypothetical protein
MWGMSNVRILDFYLFSINIEIDLTHCSILLVGGKKTPTVNTLGRGNVVHHFLKLLNLAIDIDHRSPDAISAHEGGTPQPSPPPMHGDHPLIGATPLTPLQIISCGATPPMDPILGEARRVPR